MEYNWRDDKSLSSRNIYRRKFAIWPIVCLDGTNVWWKHYFKYYKSWMHNRYSNDEFNFPHLDYIGKITEQEYIIHQLKDDI